MTPNLQILLISILFTVVMSCADKKTVNKSDIMYSKDFTSHWFILDSNKLKTGYGYGFNKNKRCFVYGSIGKDRVKTAEDIVMYWSLKGDTLVINGKDYHILNYQNDTLSLRKIRFNEREYLIKDTASSS